MIERAMLSQREISAMTTSGSPTDCSKPEPHKIELHAYSKHGCSSPVYISKSAALPKKAADSLELRVTLSVA